MTNPDGSTIGRGENLAAGGVLLRGAGFPVGLWIDHLQRVGAKFAVEGLAGAVEPPPRPYTILIETDPALLSRLEASVEAQTEGETPPWPNEDVEDEGGPLQVVPPGPRALPPSPPTQEDLFAGSLPAEPAAAPGALALVRFVPCYENSATEAAAALEPAENVVGYTLFQVRSEASGEPPVIEVARPLQTAPAAWETALAFLREVGFQVEVVGDAPGLIFARTLACVVNEAARALGDGIASARDIDAAMRLAVNYPKGPLEWADELGIDLIVDILNGLYEHYREECYRPAPLLRRLRLAGRMFLED